MSESSMVHTMSYQAFMQPSASALTQAVSFIVEGEAPAAGSAASRKFQTRLHCAQSILSGQLAADDILHRQQQHAVAPAPAARVLLSAPGVSSDAQVGNGRGAGTRSTTAVAGVSIYM